MPFGTTSKAIVSVKGGNVGVSMVRELADVVTSTKADIGVFLTLEEPTKPMKERASSAGRFKLDGYEGDVPRIQIITVEEAMRLRDRAVKIPLRFDSYKKPRQKWMRRRKGGWSCRSFSPWGVSRAMVACSTATDASARSLQFGSLTYHPAN